MCARISRRELLLPRQGGQIDKTSWLKRLRTRKPVEPDPGHTSMWLFFLLFFSSFVTGPADLEEDLAR